MTNQYSPVTSKRGRFMEILIPIAILAAWFILQAWVLPRLGVGT
jgi:hypothetical protein